METGCHGAVEEDELDSPVTEQRAKRQVRWLPAASLGVLYVGEYAMSMLRLHLERSWFRPTRESRTPPKQMGVVVPLRVGKDVSDERHARWRKKWNKLQ